MVGRWPKGSWARRRTTVSRTIPCPPHRHHQSSAVLGWHSKMALCPVMCWPMQVRSRESSRQNVVRSGDEKVGLDTSRSFGWSVLELPSSEDLGVYPDSATPCPRITDPHPQLRRARKPQATALGLRKHRICCESRVLTPSPAVLAAPRYFLCLELLETPGIKPPTGEKSWPVSEMFAPGVPGIKITLSFTVSRFDSGRQLSIK
ncbi:Uncharacterised protein [Corynebacterium diphtheriae]|nr:Uncharacterised protein [Corynebacterium diphtheriae]